jgi:hypothetical protein
MIREELERQVDDLAELYSGQDFADAVQRYSQDLRPEEQEELQAILLERARLLEDAVQERAEARGWFRRLWRDVGGPRPPRPPR